MRILYVENHAIFAANVIREFLSLHSVVVEPSLARARRALTQSTFDLLLVDYDLDDGKGDVLISELRSTGSKKIIIGVSSHEEGNKMLAKAGASAICSKMDFDQIERVIADLISE